MKNFIQYYTQLLIKFLILLLLFVSCNTEQSLKNLDKITLILPTGEEIKSYVAISHEEQSKGLSNLKNEDFPDNYGMLFKYEKEGMRQFWMPNTFFDLDIVFLSKDFYILDIHRRLKHFPKDGPKHLVPMSKKVFCRHVLEIKSDSVLSKKIHPGMFLSVK